MKSQPNVGAFILQTCIISCLMEKNCFVVLMKLISTITCATLTSFPDASMSVLRKMPDSTKACEWCCFGEYCTYREIKHYIVKDKHTRSVQGPRIYMYMYIGSAFIMQILIKVIKLHRNDVYVITALF